MTKVALFVEGTFLPSREGATRRFTGLARNMASSGIPAVVIHCYRGWSDLEAISREPFRTYAVAPDAYYHEPNLVSRILEDEKIEFCMFAEAETVVAVGLPQKERNSRLKLWYECHDVHADFYGSTGASYETTRKAQKVQMAALANSEVVTCFTREDRSSLAALLGSYDRLYSVGFGIEALNVLWSDHEGATDAVVFVGNMYHRPNQLALEAIGRHIVPGLADLGIRVEIVGDVPAALVQRYQSPSLYFRGVVEDLHRELARYALAIAPIEAGSGIKVKVLDYLAACRPTVGTSLAFRGIGERHGICVDQLSQYSGTIGRILSDKDGLSRYRSLAWAGAEKQSWSKVARQLGDLLRITSKNTPVVPISGPAAVSVLEPYFLSDYTGQSRFDPPPFEPFRNDSEVFKLGWGESVALLS